MPIDLNMTVGELKKLTREERDELFHHGIKGMRWGVSRSDDEISSTSNPDFLAAMKGIPKSSSGGSPQGISVNSDGTLNVAGGGGGGEELDDTWEELQDILGDDNMSPEEKRKAIEALGASAVSGLKEKFLGAVDNATKGFKFNPLGFMDGAKKAIDDKVKSVSESIERLKKDNVTTSSTSTRTTRITSINGVPVKDNHPVTDNKTTITKGGKSVTRRSRYVTDEDPDSDSPYTTNYQMKIDANGNKTYNYDPDRKKSVSHGESDLSHHGVKGQKWGVRRSDKQLAAARSTALTEAKSLSDTELRAKISRIQMEKQYVDLVAPLPKTSSKSNSFVREMLADTGKSIAKEQTKKYATKGVEMVASGILEKTTGVRAPKHRR